MSSQNEMKLIFDARSVNESFARVAVAAFIAELNPTLDEIADIKTAGSEAVTNAIIHGYHEATIKIGQWSDADLIISAKLFKEEKFFLYIWM